MASTFTTNTNLNLQGTGDNVGTWGGVLNTQVFTIIDAVLGNVQTLTLASTDITVTTPQSQVATIVLTGTLTANVNVIFPAIGRTYFVINQCTGAFTVTLKIASGATAISPQGSGQFFVLDGTNVYRANLTPGIGTLVAASTTDLGLAGSSEVVVTGNTTITSFGTTATTGSKITVLFTGTPQITYNATSMLIPGQAPLFIQAGDSIEAIALGSGNFRIINITRSAVAPNTGAGLSGGFRNLKVVATGAATGTITADGMTLFDANGNPVYLSAVNVSNNNAVNGKNGLDVGAVAINTWYANFVIYNPTTQEVASLSSLSASAPTMPAGFTFKLRTGWWRNAASGGYWRTIQYGRKGTLTLGTNPSASPIIGSGSIGSYSNTSPTLVSTSVANFVPSTALAIKISITSKFSPGGNNSSTILAPSSAYSGSGNGPTGSNGLTPPYWNLPGTITQGSSDWMTLESTNIFLCSSDTGGAFLLSGWEDNLN